ncbi:MAG TPA: DUF951 domain-containing protein [Clostridia bacterium]|nr:DUF951 domain-containing protein [Clostridia bacterium]
MLENFSLHDSVSMRKPHACGTNEWTIIRVGADIKIKCNACGRIVMMDRADFIKRGKRLIKKAEDK